MKKPSSLSAAVILTGITITALAAGPAASPGAAAFEANCAACHPGGRNTINPAKDLRVMTLKANGIVSVQDIVAKMRHPGPGMTRFDPKDLSDQQARAIAQYILNTFR